MDAIECIMTRRSIRKFKSVPVPWYKIGKICEAGLAAPSAGNIQDFRLMVVTDEDKKRKLAHTCMDQYWMCTAPQFIVVSSTVIKTKRFYGVRGERLYAIQSAAAAIQNILLAAHALGLAGCWVGAFDEDYVKDLLRIPSWVRVQAIIPIGYPDEVVPMPPKYGTEQMVHFNMYADNPGKVRSIEKDMLKEWSPYTVEAIDKCKDLAEKAGKACKKAGKGLGEKIKHHAKKIHNKVIGKKDKEN